GRSCCTTSSLSLHDALPIFGNVELGLLHCARHLLTHLGEQLVEPAGVPRDLGVDLDRIPIRVLEREPDQVLGAVVGIVALVDDLDRKSTRLNSSHVKISYAV